METNHPFPSRVFVRVMPACPEGLAVRLTLEMSEKNDFGYSLFIGPGSIGKVER